MTFPRPVLMRISAFAIALAAFGGVIAPSALIAQAPAPSLAPGGVLTLADAIALARRNNPTYATAVNARRTAAANLKSATGAFLPNVNTSFGGGYREGRLTLVQGQAFGSTNNQLNTDLAASANLQLSLATINDRRGALASQEATEADILAAEQTVRNNVTAQYLTALQAQANANLQDSLVATTAVQLQLAQARLQVGSGTQLDVQRAEVANGQQRVAALNQRNTAAIEIVRLFQAIGVAPVPGTRLDTNLPPAPVLDQATVLANALRTNPQLDALRAREEVANRSIASAKSTYFPALNVNAGVSAFTNRFTDTEALIQQRQLVGVGNVAQCVRSEEVRAALNLDNVLAQCPNFAFSEDQAQAIRDQQGKYPLGFTRNPYSVTATLSLPIFNGSRRETQVQQATVNRNNTQNDIRNQQLRIETEVSAAFLNLNTAQQTVTLQEQNVRTARTALELASERYRVGLASIVDLQQARGDFERAGTDLITAIYAVQRAFATLEAAVGRPLR